METPRISFVVPTRNRKQWIAECVGSLMAQTVKEIEVIVVDDASDDGTEEYLKEWLKDEPRFIYVKNKERRGGGISRNIGTALAKAPIIGVCDDDDFYSVDRAENTLKFFDENPIGYMFNSPYIRANLQSEPIEEFPGADFDEEGFKKDGTVNYFCHSSSAYTKKDFDDIGGYKSETDKVTDDYQFVKDWIGKGKKIGFVKGFYLCFHRVLPDSMMVNHRGYNPVWNKPQGKT